MAPEAQSLADLKTAVAAQAPKAEPKRDKQGRSYATGKRKDAVARVWVKPGKGKIIVNDRELEKYFVRPVLRMMINQPFSVTNRQNEFDVVCTVSGGGLSGQAGALRLGIARALNGIDVESNRASLKKAGYLTRDARVTERKKAGLKKARKAPQYSKR